MRVSCFVLMDKHYFRGVFVCVYVRGWVRASVSIPKSYTERTVTTTCLRLRSVVDRCAQMGSLVVGLRLRKSQQSAGDCPSSAQPSASFFDRVSDSLAIGRTRPASCRTFGLCLFVCLSVCLCLALARAAASKGSSWQQYRTCSFHALKEA